MPGPYVPAIEVRRGTLVESVHAAAVAVADADGGVLARLGGIDHIVYLRSSAKPFQAMVVVESGAVERFNITPRELAVMAGSHNSEPVHVTTVAGILDKIGLDASALRCGTHIPFSREVAERYQSSGRALTPLEHNCSGKHAGMLAAAVAGGHDPASYLEPSHPVQRRVLRMMSEMTGRPRDRIVVSVDGCGAPTIGVTLSEAARAFARLMQPQGLGSKRREAARLVVSTMREHPEMIAGEGMIDTEVTGHPRREVVCKRGAEGIQCIGFLEGESGRGVAAKIADGNSNRARVALTRGILRQVDLMTSAELDALRECSLLTVRTNSGRAVGSVKAVFRLRSA
ncbi:MAG: asparaginase [Acidobacteriota bacterium]